jgi:FHS family L-fucose permease-like MFS transporter
MTSFSSAHRATLNYRSAFALIVILFFTWGFLTSLNDVLVADFRSIFHLSYRSATLVQFTFFSTCFVGSFPASHFVARLGYKITIFIGLLTMSLAALCFVGASVLATFPSFLCALVAMASGSTTLQTAAGPYVSLLGPESSASSRFSLALGVNSFGAMLAPAFGAWFILRDSSHARPTAADLIHPYLFIAAGLACLAAVVLTVHLPAIQTLPPAAGSRRTQYRDFYHHPRAIFGIVTMFLYVGAEIAIGGLMINFLRQPDTSHLSLQRAAFLASLYGGGAMIGRFAGWIVLKSLRPQSALLIAAACAFSLVLTSILSTGDLAAFSLLAVGLCNSVMVPIIFTTAIAGLGPLTEKASGLLVAALVGGALIPLAQGAFADRIGLHRSFLLPALCYFAICGYGVFTRYKPPCISVVLSPD